MSAKKWSIRDVKNLMESAYKIGFLNALRIEHTRYDEEEGQFFREFKGKYPEIFKERETNGSD